MRIPCPYCGPRGNGEFAYWGDATLVRPETSPGAPLTGDTLARWMDYTYLRTNPAGDHRELWYHASGCRQWLVMTRNTLTHDILAVEAAKDRPPRPSEAA
jgi:heterotetrameric sarcosine oxidase delta subunit